ncbi:RlpA-like double-psi beta-barrel-protein domain-containing protein-containing protein [Zychaea mexicana]|uniref:RlpA-like double-psi beta-barrel-protein domain-containing protein-containing protein n=1 Tax=Zychaea mexicana TaxID=64656 RepID=UPI0022FE755F|nr:RlpA-like double-psi beta-barrel-protein domain-containing protein-containing protein [Zychaea mexicana]KAI9493575.1 RlpA-like double-psi beta-barrel-protein domain-containing protein-containing protein [Zychaea mexicana]
MLQNKLLIIRHYFVLCALLAFLGAFSIAQQQQQPPAAPATTTNSTSTTTTTTKQPQVYSGWATYHNAAGEEVGSCGQPANDNDYIVSLSAKMMSQEYQCGRNVTLTTGRKSVNVMVTSTCEGCSQYDVVLTPAAFKRLGSIAQGRIPVKWSFSD